MPPRFLCLPLLLVFASPVFADGDGERAALARLVGEIDQLTPLLEKAKVQADAKDRVHFGYGWLREDLEKVKAGIRVHLERPRTEPDTVEPLRGAYP